MYETVDTIALADFLWVIECMHGTCNKFDISVHERNADTYELRVQAWRNKVMGEPKMTPSLRRAYAGPHSWDFSIRLEGKVSKTAWETYMCCVVNCLSSSASETMALAVPAGFFAQGRTDWHYLSCHLPTVRHVSLRIPETVLPRFIDPDCTSWLSTVGA